MSSLQLLQLQTTAIIIFSIHGHNFTIVANLGTFYASLHDGLLIRGKSRDRTLLP